MTIEAAEILEAIKVEIRRTQSPWADRAEAAAYCHCSASEVDKAANEGKIKRHWRNNTPIFKKHGLKSLDEWIESGAMPAKRKEKLLGKQTNEQI